MAILSGIDHLLHSFPFPKRQARQHDEKHKQKQRIRRPSFRRRTTKPAQQLTVSVQQTASEWSQTTLRLFETATFRPPPVPTRRAPLPPHKLSLHSPRPSQTSLMARREAFKPSSLSEPLSPAAVADIIRSVGRAFKGMSYAVCGLGAMVYYGFDRRVPWQVSVVCPVQARQNMRGWAMASGMRPAAVPDDQHAGEHDAGGVDREREARLRRRLCDVFILTTRDGFERRIRIKFTHDFSGLRRTWSASLSAWVLTLPSLADQVALGYVQSLLLPSGTGTGTGESSAQRQQLFASDMSWLLHRMARQPSSSVHCLTPERVTHIMDSNFWLPFTLSYPGAVELFTAANLHFEPEDQASYLLESSSSGSETHFQRGRSKGHCRLCRSAHETSEKSSLSAASRKGLSGVLRCFFGCSFL
ncbi:hypothetical protein HJFPF1_01682 [Paramyrothecium foliicola]|nr:hypothetical protein HJFPF1_01682 [Paramyrothecium foliicola]